MQLKSWRGNDRAAEYVCLPLDKFNIDGPNGTHYCFVYHVLGPRASLGLYRGSEDPDQVLRSVCLKATEAMSFLHAHKICHGGKFTASSELKRALQKLIMSILDFTPKNILHRISGVDGLSEDEVLGAGSHARALVVCNGLDGRRYTKMVRTTLARPSSWGMKRSIM